MLLIPRLCGPLRRIRASCGALIPSGMRAEATAQTHPEWICGRRANAVRLLQRFCEAERGFFRAAKRSGARGLETCAHSWLSGREGLDADALQTNVFAVGKSGLDRCATWFTAAVMKYCLARRRGRLGGFIAL